MKNLMKVIALFMLILFTFNLSAQRNKRVVERIFYNFYAKAPSATWKSTTHGSSKVHHLKFGAYKKDVGNARNINRNLENGIKRDVLHTRPKNTSNGVIRGYFPAINNFPANSRLTGSIGFIKPPGSSKSDGARFLIYVKYYDNTTRKHKNVKVFNYYKPYNGKMKNIEIDLSRFAGKRVSIELRVDSEKKSKHDWAVWHQLYIIKPITVK